MQMNDDGPAAHSWNPLTRQPSAKPQIRSPMSSTTRLGELPSALMRLDIDLSRDLSGDPTLYDLTPA